MEQKTNYLFGMHPVFEAIAAGKNIEKVLLKKGLGGEQFQQLFSLLQEKDFVFKRKRKLFSIFFRLEISQRHIPCLGDTLCFFGRRCERTRAACHQRCARFPKRGKIFPDNFQAHAFIILHLFVKA